VDAAAVGNTGTPLRSNCKSSKFEVLVPLLAVGAAAKNQSKVVTSKSPVTDNFKAQEKQF